MLLTHSSHTCEAKSSCEKRIMDYNMKHQDVLLESLTSLNRQDNHDRLRLGNKLSNMVAGFDLTNQLAIKHHVISTMVHYKSTD